MAAASLIGFGLVVLAVSALTALVFNAALLSLGPRLRASGPRWERRAATLTLALPPLLGVGVSTTLATTSLLAYWEGRDHCLGHSHHLHLCPVHGAGWLLEPWAVAAVAFFATFVLVRLGQTIGGHVGAHRAARRLRRFGRAVPCFERTFIVPSAAPFAFTTGVFSPTVIISEAAWVSLAASQKQAVLAHEHAHVKNRDLLTRAVLGLLAHFGVPGLSHRTLRIWESASERTCDRVAVRKVGRPSIVASAILTLAQAQTKKQAPALAVFAATGDVRDRVHSLFDHPATTDPPAKKLLACLLLCAGAVAIGSAIFAESLHHLLETILG